MITDYLYKNILFACTPAFLVTVLLLAKSLLSFTRAGPQIRQEVVSHYRFYTVYAVLRLAAWAFIINIYLSLIGILVYACLLVVTESEANLLTLLAFASASIGLFTAMQFTKQLLFIPSSITASFQYRYTRLYPLWFRLSPTKIKIAQGLTFSIVLAVWDWHWGILPTSNDGKT